jgi:Nucleotidyl transferase AbiEii toxin, Type IV TA system
MRTQTFWQTVTADRTDFLGRLLALLRDGDVRYCLVGGQAVNAYADPVVSLDLDLAVAVDQLPAVAQLLAARFRVERFPHSLNVSDAGSDLRVQIQTDLRYGPFVERAETHEVLGIPLPVARVEDVLQGKVWAVTDATQRPSKRQKDLADIARLLERYPAFREQVPADVLARLV